MVSTPGTTTIEVPLPVRERLARLRVHARQPYHEVISRGLDLLEGITESPGLDPLVARHRKALRNAAHRHKIARLWLYGSRARGEPGVDADVDLLCQTMPEADAFDLAGFLADARELLGVHVDVADLDGLRMGLREQILAEAVVV